MGQIDSDKMYTNIMNWEWEIVAVMKYIMIETRREA
jgi:hypothetical protein